MDRSSAATSIRDSCRSGSVGRSLQYACPRCRGKVDLFVLDGRCPACGFQPRNIDGVLSFVNDLETNEWQRLFDAQAKRPDADTSAAIFYRCTLQHRHMIDGVRRVCGSLAPDARALDVGCGNGILWAEAFGTKNVIGVDYSHGMCKLARARGMLAYHANALALPFAADQFDLVYSAEAIQYIDDIQGVLRELGRVCRPGGHIVISTQNRSSIARRAVLAAKGLLGRASSQDPIYVRSGEDIAAAADGLPLAIDSVWWLHFPFRPLYRTSTTERPFKSLASNVIIRFVRTDN
ncbi:MAG: methyltransferase domain-containing protein [Hyphomicrobiales bacterium]|nr:methyltransferase domain-containing protein [Hyphomicrobiales bacterium]